MCKSGKHIVVLGQYRTGTTGLFFKIRNSLRAGVRTLIEPEEYVPHSEDADGYVLAKVILGVPGRTHRVQYETFLNFDRKIYLVRDPRDWVVSGVLFLMQANASLYNDEHRWMPIIALLKSKEKNPKSLPTVTILARILEAIPHQSLEDTRGWIDRQFNWLLGFERRFGDHFRLKYEDFVDNRLDPLEKYLDLPLTGKGDVDPNFEHVARTLSYGDWRHWFVEEDIEFFKPLFGEYLKRHGYSQDWSTNAEPVIKPQYCSQYAERIVRWRRTATEHKE